MIADQPARTTSHGVRLPPTRARGGVAVLAHAYYDEDSRVRRECTALVRAGRPVDVFALRRPGEPSVGDLDGVAIHRLDVRRHQGAGIAVYVREYLDFFARGTIALARAHRSRRYALVHVNSLPDFLVFAALPLKLAGVPVLLDLHEAMPEFFGARFPRRASRLAHGLLRVQERASISAADAVVTVNDALRDRLVALGTPPGKVSVILNTPDVALFDPAAHETRPFMADGVLRLVYAGALTPTYEIDIAIAALAALSEARPGLAAVLEIYGRGDAEAALRARAVELALGDRVRFHGRIPLELVPAAVARADIGLAPTRQTEFTDFSLSTKLFEYAAMRKPAVASALQTVARYFDPGTIATYRPGDPADLARVLLAIVDDPDDRSARVAATAARAAELSWDREAGRYCTLVERLVGRD
jgi:glycosyltransferase involved in cell wall biosynthesis